MRARVDTRGKLAQLVGLSERIRTAQYLEIGLTLEEMTTVV